MKTEKQIERWLQSRKWYITFELQTLASLPSSSAFGILSGSYLRNTITGAFYWINTLEGVDYWAERNKEFIKWFES